MNQDREPSAAESRRYQRAVEIFLGACELPQDRRDGFMLEACTGDHEVLATAKSLLLQDASPDDGVEEAVTRATALLAGEEHPIPESIGPYRVLHVLGEGGMGTVYEAEQENPRRRVALKVVRAAMATPRVCRRFELEAEVLGRLEHPGIARIYEAGSAEMPWGAVPFLAMELVRGRPLDAHCEDRGLDLRARVALIARVCDAVEHAHQRGVVHRDLKPQNVLVDEQGDPKVLDFGVAWLAGPERESHTTLTLEGQVIGTLAYMSPEQVRGEHDVIDARTDVYALGVIGYELLARRLPLHLEGKPLAEAARVVEDLDPPRLSLLAPACDGDLDVIFAKALEKEPARRYASAAEFAADLRRFLAEQPIVARPPSRRYLLQKFARRNRTLVSGVAVAVFSLLLGTAVLVWKAIEASDALDFAEQRTEDAQRNQRTAEDNAYRANLAAALTALRGHNVIEAAARLEDAPPALRNWEWLHLRARLDESIAVFAADGAETLSALALEPDQRRVAGGGEDGTIRVWDWETGALIASRKQRKQRIVDLQFASAAPRLFVASVSGYPDHQPSVTELELPSLEVTTTWNTPGQGTHLRFADDSPRVAGVRMGRDRSFVAFDRASGRIEARSAGSRVAMLTTLSPDGRLAGIVWDEGHGFEIRDVEQGTPLLSRDDLLGVNSLRFNADATQVVVAMLAPNARVLEVSTGRELLVLAGHEAGVTDAQFAPDGSQIFTASADGTVRAFETVFGTCVLTLHGHRGPIQRMVLSPDVHSIATAGSDGTVRRWDVTADDDRMLPHGGAVYAVAFSPDGSRIATGCLAKDGPGLKVWDAETGELVAEWIDAEVTSLDWSRDGTRLAVGVHNKRTLTVDAETGVTLGSFAYHRWHTDSVAFDASGCALLSSGLDGMLVLQDLTKKRTIWSSRLGSEQDEPIYRSGFSPDGACIVATRSDGTLVVFDAESHTERGVIRGHSAPVVAMAFSSDGKWLASGARDGEIVIASFPDGVLSKSLHGHVNEVFALAFSPDGSRLASGGRDRTIRIWDPRTGTEVAQLGGHTSYVYDLAFSSDGRMLVSAGGDDCARVWDTHSAAERLGERRERARIAAEVAPTVDQILADGTEPRAAVERLHALAFESDRAREVALQLALQKLVERTRKR